MKEYKYIFLDLDDTIWDFHSNAKLSLQQVFHAHRLDEYFKDFHQYFELYVAQNTILWEMYGKGEISKDKLSLERFLYPLKQVGIHSPKLALDMGKEYLDLLPSFTSLLPGAIDVLDYLSQKYTLTIVSNGFVEVQYKKMKNSNLEQYFSHIVLSEDAKALKPDKRIFEYALQLNQATPNETVMIGDSYEADILGAINAGIDQVFLTQHMEDKQVTVLPTHVISHLRELMYIL